MNKAVIFSGGKITDYNYTKDFLKGVTYVACADSGILHCENMGLNSDLWVGDFDSSDYNHHRNHDCVKNAQIVNLNTMKDDTDTEHTLDLVIKKGYKQILLAGGIGTRFDHTLANVFLMEKAYMMGANLILFNENNIIYYVKNSAITLENRDFKYVSVLPLEEVSVSFDGMMYPSNDSIFKRASSRGISNEIIDKTATIRINEGSAVVIQSKD